MSVEILILDYGTGNLSSVERSLKRIGATSIVSSSAEDIAGADKIILPGVGHFGKAMESLRQLRLLDALNKAVLTDQKPVLGICLGMELMARKSEEGNTTGLGWIDAEVVRFDISAKLDFKVPHIGWNQMRIKKDSALFRGLSEESEFYFLHSYHLGVNEQSDVLAETEYETAFPSAIERENISVCNSIPKKVRTPEPNCSGILLRCNVSTEDHTRFAIEGSGSGEVGPL